MIKILPLHNHNPLHRGTLEYLRAYQTWHQSWLTEHKNLGVQETLFSDPFTRQDAVLALFINDECAGLSLLRTLDISNVVGRSDSSFACWPENIIAKVNDESSTVLMCSGFALDKKFRGQRYEDIAIRDIVASASVNYFRMSNVPVMLGTTRNTRGVNRLFDQYGAKHIKTVLFHGEPSDLVIFRQNEIPEFPERLQSLLNQAWITEESKIKVAA